MKKLIFLGIFLFIFSGVYGQTRLENRWILGIWVGTDASNRKYELVLNDNGTGIWNEQEIIFAIEGNMIILYSTNGNSLIDQITIHRINDQRIIMNPRVVTGGNLRVLVNFNKVN